MVIKIGKYGKFLACPGYPECRNAKPLIEYADFNCPKCGSQVQIRKTKKRRSYYICENNKGIGEGCYYISWNKPKPGEKFVPSNDIDMTLYKENEKKNKTKTSKTKKDTKKKVAKKTATKKSK